MLHTQVEECSIKFNAKISSMTQSATNSSAILGTNAATAASAGGSQFYTASSYSAAFSSQNTARSSNTEQREFSLEVYVRARQADMPGGMAKILSMLEDSIYKQ